MERQECYRQTTDIFGRLSAPAQMSLLKFARFLESDEKSEDFLPYDKSEMDEDVALYDEAASNDDGYRISGEDLRREYGI